MKIVNYLIIVLMSLFIVSCSKVTEPVKEIGLGSKVIKYQEEEKVDSLVLPPNLTEPDIKGDFSKVIQLGEVEIARKNVNVEVLRDNYRRWLLVDLSPSDVWTLSKEFFRSYGFTIEKENQKTGILETDYLEIETKVPDRSLGKIRAALAKALKTQYGLPIADKYRLRVESHSSPQQSEVYLTLFSIGEVVNGDMRLWQPREKDVELETEMLLQLMLFLGESKSEAINKINENNKLENPIVEVLKFENGFARLVFPYDKDQAWRYLGWALDELGIEVEDRDSFEGSYFINVEPNKGFFSKLMSTVGSAKTYQLFVKQTQDLHSEVYFVDLTEENERETIEYSFELFNDIKMKF
ncbi:MAG: outer membrane protein assembly factor BamC [Woeseiaceae bacterium]|jgi:outer membrane protein assembly factor BamC|nr:outer membrane protein assembly factor BamC [Woeseiaceae bacterium]